MKKIAKIVLSLFVVTVAVHTTHAQANMQGNIIIDPYYGAPNWGKYLTSAFTSDNTNFRLSNITGLGPMGIRGEYMVSDKIGVGLDVIYNTLNASFSFDSLTVNGDVYKTFTGEMEMKRIRVMPRFNFHFQVNNPALDAYFGLGAGFNGRFVKFTSNDPEFNDHSIKGFATLIPVSFRICTGMRYYFTQNIGIHGEIGLGGPTVSAGLSIRF